MSSTVRKLRMLPLKLGLCLLVLLIGLSFTETAVLASPVTLSPISDSYVHQGTPSSNYGTSTSLYVKNDAASSRQAFLTFNLSEIYGSSSYNTVLSDTTYNYYIIARDVLGNRSLPSSSTVTVKTMAYSGPPPICTNALNSTAAIQNAMKSAAPGDIINIAPGTYTGVRSTSGDPGGQGLFYSGQNGNEAAPIIMKSCDPADPAVLKGSKVNDGSYGIHLTGDYWQIRDIEIDTAQKGVVLDHGNHNLLHGLKVHNIGDEAVHFRDGSSYNTLEYSTIYDTGQYQPGYGEGAYVGSDSSSNYEHLLYDNVIRHTVFDGGITGEHIDIKEGASGTIVEYCTFNGTGISGANSADSFIDVKGVNTIVRYNQGYRNGNANITDAFQVRTHGTVYPTGTNNSFYSNTVNLDDSSGYVVYATGATTGTTAQDDVRIGGGKLYNNNVNK